MEREDLELVSHAGYRIAATRLRLRGAGALPGLVVSPAMGQARAGLATWSSPVTPEELARLGYDVLVHDPAGRGDSWGEDDFGGPEHADDLRIAARHLHAQGVPWLGVLALSLGLSAATAALARWPEDLRARWLLDWEGPSDREVSTFSGTRMDAAGGHGLEDDSWWLPREAVCNLAGVRCGYWRLQAVPDHAQPTELRHARRMVDAAARAHARRTLPWFALNTHPRGELPSRPTWLRGGTLAAHEALVQTLAVLRDETGER